MARGNRRWLRSLLGRAGYDVQPVGDAAWLVQRPRSGDRRLSLQRVGSAKDGPMLVVDDHDTSKRWREQRDALDRHYADEHLGWVLRKLRINCVLDVGANRGQFARRLRRLGFTERIASFEPVPDLVADLRRAAADDPLWSVFAFALGEEDGSAEINVVPGKMSSMLEPSDFGREWATKLRSSHPEPIEVRRLDSVLDEATAGLSEPRILLKLDTQGYDLPAFRGAGARQADILALQSELACVPIYEGMPRMPEQLSEYESAGFEVSAMFPVTRHRKSMRLIEVDVLMVRQDAAGGPDEA